MELKKGVAIPYIIALVIGIIVLVFIIYWVYRLFTAPQISYEDCRSRMIQWCTSCKSLGWSGGGKLEDFISKDCLNLLKNRVGIAEHEDCATPSEDNVKTDCKKVGFVE